MPFECNISYDYRKNENLLLIDLDLPEIEDFPNQKAVQLANGNMKLKRKTLNFSKTNQQLLEQLLQIKSLLMVLMLL